jgi:predicted dehydrogenase
MPAGNVNRPDLEPAGRKLRVGVVGIGYLGRFHAEKYAAIPGAKIVGLADLLPQRAREWADKLGTEAFSSYRSLLGKVDAVSVVVPTDRHYEVSREFLLAGSDVLVEKPIASTIEEAEELIALARKQGKILQVGHVERFNPVILAAREKIRVPLFVECRRLTRFRGRGAEVDVVLDLMIHDLDIILSIVRSPVREVRAAGALFVTEKTDIANARLEFDCGSVADVSASRVSLEDCRRMRVFQPGTCLTLDYGSKEVSLLRRSTAPEKGGFRIAAEKVEVRSGDALEAEIRSFVHSSVTRTAPAVTGEDGRDALALAFRINEKIRKNLEKVPSIVSFYEQKNTADLSLDGSAENTNAWRGERKES